MTLFIPQKQHFRMLLDNLPRFRFSSCVCRSWPVQTILMFALDQAVPSGVCGCQEAYRKTQGALPSQNKSWTLVKFLRRGLKGFSSDHLENTCISRATNVFSFLLSLGHPVAAFNQRQLKQAGQLTTAPQTSGCTPLMVSSTRLPLQQDEQELTPLMVWPTVFVKVTSLASVSPVKSNGKRL